MREIIGNTTSTPMPRSDWAQTDANKADFIKNKPELGALATKDEIAKTDLAADVQASLDKANSAIQSVDDKVDKIDGKGLSTNDYTTVEKEKLARIAEDANNYVHPETHPADIITGLAKVATSGSYTDLTNRPTIPSVNGLATEDYVDGKIAAIPTPDVSGQINTHNTNTSAHADIRKQISQLSSEIVDEVQSALIVAKTSGQFDGKSAYKYAQENGYLGTEAEFAEDINPNNIKTEVNASAENLIVTELAKRGQLKPEFAQSEEWLDANGDTSKLYVLPDGMIWANILTETEGETKPNFQNVMDKDDAYFLNGKRAKSSGIFEDKPTDCAIVIPITGGATQTIRVRGAGNEAEYKATAYWGTNNQSLTLQGSGATRTVEENGDIKIVTKHPSTASYMVFHVQAGVEADTLIVTIDQEITYTTEEDKIEYKWASTGHAFVPADYENRILNLEDKAEENAERISELEDEMNNPKPTGIMTMFISPSGNDSNSGLSVSSPKKTVKACVDAGATRISAKRGTYNERITLSDIDELEIFPTDNDYTFNANVKRYPPIIFDTSHAIPVGSLSDYNSIKKVSYAETNEALNYVFNNGLYDTVYSTTHGYHAVLWAITDNIKNDFKLRPMATIAEVEATTNSFTWVNNTLYLNANFTDVTEIRVPTIYDNAFTVFTANKVKLTDVEVRFAGRYSILIENCPDVEMDNCSVKYTSNGSGFDFKNVNGTLRNCYASRVHDGYGIGDYGHTIFIDCVAEWCYDDGMSHHRGCTGTVIGGRYEGNVKAGNCPAHGAHVNIYGGLYKDNGLWGIAYWYENTYNPCTGMIQGAVMTGNKTGLAVDTGSKVTAVDCHYIDNTVDKDITGTLIEITGTNAVNGQQSIEFVNSVNDCVDEDKIYVLSDGRVITYAGGSEDPGESGITNLMDDKNARIEDGKRYSHSANNGAGGFIGQTGISAVVVPIKTKVGENKLRIRGAEKDKTYSYLYTSGSLSNYTSFPGSLTVNWTTENNGDLVCTFTTGTVNETYATFTVVQGASADTLIVTLNQEIGDGESDSDISYPWKSTGHAFVPDDYKGRFTKVENDIQLLKEKAEGVTDNATTVFSTPAYAPIPQLPADGSETADFHGLNVTTEQAYTYMDALANKHKGYVTKQTMGKDQSETYDHNRYILCKSYWRAWLKPNYPMMFAWINGSAVIYSVSASPRVGDTMYTTPYIGTAYSTVTAVNCSTPDATNGIPGTPSTRTVNGLVFTRHKSGDVEPTVVYTKVATSLSDLNGGTVYNSAFSSQTKVTVYTKEAITCADGITYSRYPFEDLKADKTKPLSVFALANEHGHRGDNKVPSIVLMRMAKDLCENRENPFLQWMKENVMLTVIPVGNPWGYDPSAGDMGAGYNNSRGVNINRNYDTPGWAGSDNNYGDDTTFGAYAGSENETQHIMNTMHLCKAKVGLSMHGLGLGQYKTKATEYTDGLMWQGCGFDKTRMAKVAEVLFSDYGQLIGGHTSGDQSYEYCGKSPAYIQYVGAVGGLNEIPDYETGTLDLYTPTVMEASYTQMLLFLQTWCEEALEKQG